MKKIYFFYFVETNEFVNFNNSFNHYLKRVATTKGVGIRSKIVCLKKLIRAIEEGDVKTTKEILNIR